MDDSVTNAVRVMRIATGDGPEQHPIETAPKDGSWIEVLSLGHTVRTPWDEPETVHPEWHKAKWWPEGTSWTNERGEMGGSDVDRLSVTGVWLTDDDGWLQPNEVTHWRHAADPPPFSV